MSDVPAWLGDGADTPRSVALDTMCFIYRFEADPSYLEATRQLFDAVERGVLKASASVLALTEVLVTPLRAGRTDLVEAYRDILTAFPSLTLAPVDERVAASAAELRARHGLRTPDALHVATALGSGAEVFVTADRKLARVDEVRVVMLPEDL